jgi:uncharacterized membrane protein YozB (DUF420 family)
MSIIPYLPHLQAGLNLITISLIGMAYYQIRQQNRSAHRKLMITALSVSLLFMISYLTYHGAVGNVKFAGEGFIRPIYFSILISHVVLAAAIVPLVLITLTLALKGNFTAHRKVARWTFPLWIYVSISGIVVYLFAFHLYPSAVGLA